MLLITDIVRTDSLVAECSFPKAAARVRFPVSAVLFTFFCCDLETVLSVARGATTFSLSWTVDGFMSIPEKKCSRDNLSLVFFPVHNDCTMQGTRSKVERMYAERGSKPVSCREPDRSKGPGCQPQTLL